MGSHLQESVHFHSPNPGLQCPTCKRVFTSRSKLRVHRLREAGEKIHKCHLCDYSAVERNAIRRHIISVHADSDVAEGGLNRHTYACPSCGLRFHQSKSLKAHMKTHNIPRGSDSATCILESCSFQTSSHKELLKHILDVHGVKAVECRYHACGAVFQTEAEMLTHFQTHRAYHCSQCDFTCSNKALFLRHQRSGHAGCDKLCCDFCSFFTFNPVQSERHVRRCHPNEKIHRCSQCSYATSHRRSLKRHTLTHNSEKPHKCGVCDFRCRDESSLSRHMLTHSDDKNFMCSDCGYVTKWKHYLTVHMRKHAGDMRHQCDQCTYRCHRTDQLKSHKLRHQAKSLICEICAFACKRKYELRSHMTSKHSGGDGHPPVHQCTFCTYTTRYRQALRNHENCQHTRLKEFHCALCPYVSFSTVSLFLHKRKAHGYVPGDQRWLEKYAAKEKERSSTEEAGDFYRKSFTADRLKRTAEGERGPQGERAEAPAAAELRKQTETKNTKSVGVLDNEPQEGGNESLTGSSDEYCTLILTTYSETLKGKEDLPRSTCLSEEMEEEEEEEEEETSVNEECDLDSVSQETPELVGRTFSPNTDPEFTCVQNQKIKNIDSDQTEASVLDGPVQVLVVPDTDADETVLNSHGAQVKTQGLDGRLPNQSPGFSEKRPTAGENCSKGNEGSENPTDQELHQPEITSSSSSSSSSSAAEPQHQQRESVDTGTDGRFRCELCSFTSLRPTTFQRHVTACQKRVRQRDSRVLLALHLEHEHQEGHPEDEMLACGRCSFASPHRPVLERHLQTHDGNRLYKCRDCEYSTGNRQKMTRHIRTHTGEKPYGCRLCTYTCADPSRLKLHLRVHQEEKKYLCPDCGYRCKWSSQLKYHMTRHTGEKSYACGECDYRTNRADALRAHRDTQHCDLRPYMCEKCGKAFKTRFILNTHQRQHSDARLYTCGLCPKAFRWPAGLRHHFLSHTNQQPFGCGHCSYRARQKFQVVKHLRRRHPGASVEEGVVKQTEAMSLTLKEALQGSLGEG